MPDPNPNLLDAPILLLTPVGNDAVNAASVLDRASIPSKICSNMADLCRKADDSTRALLISEESFDESSIQRLVDFLSTQPPWSDIPLILITAAGDITQKLYNILNFFGTRANVTLLEKPLRAITLVSVVRAALRSRNHQYEVRSLLESYSLAMDGAQMGSWDFDVKTKTARRSLRHDQIFGYSTLQSEWNVEIFLDHVLTEDRADVRNIFEKAKPDDILFFECRIRWPDQSIHWINVQGRVYGDGKPARMAGVVTDITSRKEMESASVVQRERLDLVLEGTAVGLWYWDIPENKMVWNARCKEQHGLAPNAEVTPATLYERILPEDRERIRAALAWALRDSHLYDYEYRTVDRKWIRSIGQVFLDREGEPVRFDGITMDVTKRKEELEILHQAQEKLKQTAADLDQRVKERTAKLEETVSEMEAFSYSVSHDVRAPLRAMQAYSELLMQSHSDQLDDQGRDFLMRISRASDRLDRLTRDLLTYSRVVRNPVTMAPINLDRLVPEIILQYPDFHPSRADIEVEAPLLNVMGHEASLIQCISNIVGNAIKFVPADVKPRIKIRTESVPQNNKVKIWFEDNGIGIEADQLSRIFGIFERVSKKYDGTGIGLAIVRKAAERMGGTVGVESTLGRGSRFWVELPAA